MGSEMCIRDRLGRVVMFPCALGTRWVATVADVAARLEPRGPGALLAWAAVLVAATASFAPGRATAAGPAEPAAVIRPDQASIASSDSTDGAK